MRSHTSKKSLTIPKGQPEAVNEGKKLSQEKRQNDKQRITKHFT